MATKNCFLFFRPTPNGSVCFPAFGSPVVKEMTRVNFSLFPDWLLYYSCRSIVSLFNVLCFRLPGVSFTRRKTLQRYGGFLRPPNPHSVFNRFFISSAPSGIPLRRSRRGCLFKSECKVRHSRRILQISGRLFSAAPAPPPPPPLALSALHHEKNFGPPAPPAAHTRARVTY